MTDPDNKGMTDTAVQDPPEAPAEPVTSEPAPSAEVVPVRDAVAVLDDSDDIVIPTPVAGLTLRFTKDQTTLTPENMRLLAPLGIEADYDPGQVMVFLLDCRARGFNPWAREAFLYKIAGKYVRHVGIEGMRRKAEETGEYVGQTEPEFCGPDGRFSPVWLRKDVPPSACRVGILRKGFDAPVYRTVLFEEYAPMIDEEIWRERPGGGGRQKIRTNNKVPAANWKPPSKGGKPTTMLQKCAEAAAFRATFPNRFQGYYVPEETAKMRQDAEAEAQNDAATERRMAAFRKATGQVADNLASDARPRERGEIIDSTAVETPPPLDDSQMTPERFRELGMAELTWQAALFGRDMAWMTKRWSASRQERPFDTATPAEVVEHALRFRPYAIGTLREAGRDDEADAYERAASTVATMDELLGRAADADPATRD